MILRPRSCRDSRTCPVQSYCCQAPRWAPYSIPFCSHLPHHDCLLESESDMSTLAVELHGKQSDHDNSRFIWESYVFWIPSIRSTIFCSYPIWSERWQFVKFCSNPIWFFIELDTHRLTWRKWGTQFRISVVACCLFVLAFSLFFLQCSKLLGFSSKFGVC